MKKQEEQEEAYSFYNQKLQEAEAQVSMANIQNAQQSMTLPEPDTNLIREQLDLGPELKRIDYLLRSYTLGESGWVKPTDNNLIILSPFGVHILREFISWYVNKNTLLSAYEEEMILDKMKDCATVLNELIFRNYEKIFNEPTFEDCKKILQERIEKQVELRSFTANFGGAEISKDDIRKKLVSEIEDLDEQMLRIRKELRNDKLKRFSFILRTIQDTVHSAYNRAWNGAERRSLRQHMNITETKGGFSMPPELQQSRGGLRKLFGS